MQQLCILLTLFFFACSEIQQEKKITIPWDDNLSVEKNIAKNAIPFPTDQEFLFLDEMANTKTVIMFGEVTHYDLTTTKVKIEMINYLREKGINNLAMESSPFLSTYLFSNPEYQQITNQWKVEYLISPLWHRQEPFDSLIQHIKKQEVKLYGIDVHLGTYDILAARSILEKHSSQENVSLLIDWNELDKLYLKILILYGQYSSEEQFKLMRMIDSISNYTNSLISQEGKKTDLSAIMQWIRNVNTGFSYVKYNTNEHSDKQPLIFRNRDSQMAENIIWYTTHFHEKKFILWCANFHGSKDISQTTYPTDSLRYFLFQSMGENIYNKLGNKYYALGFTSLNIDEEIGLLESEIANVTDNAPFAFIDLKSLRFEKGYIDQEFECSLLGRKKGKWTYIYDGIYYIRDQKSNKMN